MLLKTDSVASIVHVHVSVLLMSVKTFTPFFVHVHMHALNVQFNIIFGCSMDTN